jgi:hypothetical protein
MLDGMPLIDVHLPKVLRAALVLAGNARRVYNLKSPG